MDEKIDKVEEPKPKRTRKKKEPVEVAEIEEAAEVAEVPTEKKTKAAKVAEEPKIIGYMAKVKATSLYVREKPTQASQPVKIVKMNDALQILSEENGWGCVGNGYVMLKFVERID